MQLAGVKISNLFSFPYLPDLLTVPELTFHHHEKSQSLGDLNVLIGPNGSGKSSFIDIINQAQLSLVHDYIFAQDLFDRGESKYMHSVITHQDIDRDHVLSRHFSTPDKPAELMLRLRLTEHDYDNIRFLSTHTQEINELIAQYSTLDVVFPQVSVDEFIANEGNFTFHCILDANGHKFSIVETGLTPLQSYVLAYLKYFELVQICIDIHNMQPGKHNFWSPLFVTFAILKGNRTLEGMPSSVNPDVWNPLLSKKDSSPYHVHIGYYFCAKKLWALLDPKDKDMSTEMVAKRLAGSEFFTTLLGVIQKYFAKTLRVSYMHGFLNFDLVDDAGHPYRFVDLSDGEQSLLEIIFTIYGYDLKGGMLIIDEPEVHFHPQMQRSLSRMMEKISAHLGTQFIVSTYSPLFINDHNITHVYRFAKIDNATVVSNPSLGFSGDEATLLHLLKFENLSKIFFVNKIIMVEGETDAYFFEFYLAYLHTLPEWKKRVSDYEIININGKGSYKVWKKFLSKFGISSYFIGDWDNIVDYGFLTQNDLTYYYKQSKTHHGDRKSRTNHYNKLVTTIKDFFPKIYNKLLVNIVSLYEQEVFILKKGDIETYIGLPEKGLEPTVNFCHHDFKKWLTDKQYEPHRNEFSDIFGDIFA